MNRPMIVGVGVLLMLVVVLALATFRVPGLGPRGAEDAPQTADARGETQGAASSVAGWSDFDRSEFLGACLEASGGERAYCDCALQISEEVYPDLSAAVLGEDSAAVARVEAECLPLIRPAPPPE